MIRSVIYLGLNDLAHRWRETLLAAGVVGVSLLLLLVVSAYKHGLENRYAFETDGYLLVQQSGTLGEIKGSRLPIETAEELVTRGTSLIVPQLHTITGTSAENAILLRGVPLENYTQVEPFRMIAGRPLQMGDPPRTTMIGIELAESKGIGPGDTIAIRGRSFTVVGLFAVDTYADFEAWLPLAEAQQLLGWGNDVSVFVIPAGEGLKLGDTLPGGITVVLRGQTAGALLAEWDPLFALLGLVISVLALAAAVALTNMLWRQAWVRRRQLAILRSLGFRQRELAIYLLVHGAGITALAYIFGLAGTLFFTTFAQIQSIGLTIDPVIGAAGPIQALLLGTVIAVGASVIPAWWLSRYKLFELMRAEP